jgi:hypothetical protein
MNIWERIQRLEDPRHRKGLEWFLRHSGKVMNVPPQLEGGTNLHFPSGGGMFKPSKSNYVLSVRSSHRANLESLYTDPEPQKTDTGWRYKYQQVITIGGPKWKNNGMQSNIEDVVPVGVALPFRVHHSEGHDRQYVVHDDKDDDDSERFRNRSCGVFDLA